MDTRERVEELPEHRMLTDEVTGPFAVRPRSDLVAEGQFVIKLEENNAVRPKSDMDADQMTDKEIEIENDEVRRTCDIDAEEMTDNKIKENAVRPKGGIDAEAFDEVANNKNQNENGAAAAKKILEVNETTIERFEHTVKKMHQRQQTNKKTRTYSKNTRRLQRNQERTRHQNLPKEGYSSLSERMKKTKSLHQEKALPMSLENSGELHSKLYDDDQKDETEMESDRNETENNRRSRYRCARDERNSSDHDWRVADCHQET